MGGDLTFAVVWLALVAAFVLMLGTMDMTQGRRDVARDCARDGWFVSDGVRYECRARAD